MQTGRSSGTPPLVRIRARHQCEGAWHRYVKAKALAAQSAEIPKDKGSFGTPFFHIFRRDTKDMAPGGRSLLLGGKVVPEQSDFALINRTALHQSLRLVVEKSVNFVFAFGRKAPFTSLLLLSPPNPLCWALAGTPNSDTSLYTREALVPSSSGSATEHHSLLPKENGLPRRCFGSSSQ